MKNFLIVTHKGHFIEAFLMHNIEMLRNEGFTVHCASNYTEKLDAMAKVRLESLGMITHQIDIIRSPYSPANFFAYQQLKALMDQYDFACVHCHTPTGGVLARLAARKKRKKGTKVIYTAHGFHFFKGAPLKNWVLFYPVERLCAHWTDVLITINKEDYERAKHFRAGHVCYIPGVGVDISKFSRVGTTRLQKRKQLNFSEQDIILLSVGELIPRKNHAVVLEVMAQLKNEESFKYLHYVICGCGELEGELIRKTNSLGIEGHVHLLGFREDISELYNCSDLFIFMSLQEGLPVALMEAMANGLPVICSDVRGNTDLIRDGVSGRVIPNNALNLSAAIRDWMLDKQKYLRYAAEAQKTIQEFDLLKVQCEMQAIYSAEGSLMDIGGGET